MTRRAPGAGFTLVEVLVAIVIFMILIVPLGWLTIQTSVGRSKARRIDDAVALAREDWGLVRRTIPTQIADTVYERSMGERLLRVERSVDTTAVPADSASSAFAPATSRRSKTDIRTCVISSEESAGADTVKCFFWRVALVAVQP